MEKKQKLKTDQAQHPKIWLNDWLNPKLSRSNLLMAVDSIAASPTGLIDAATPAAQAH